MTDLKVVELHSESKPLVGSLETHIKELIYNYCDDKDVSISEVVGALEFAKYHFIKSGRDDEL